MSRLRKYRSDVVQSPLETYLREINGKQLPSIFREYANALAQGLTKHYSR